MIAIATWFREATPEQLERCDEARHIRRGIDLAKDRFNKAGKRCKCPSGIPIFVDGEGSGNNWRRVECGICNTWIDWISHPDNAKSRRKTHARKTTEYCQLCLRETTSLEPHHIIEVSMGGGDEPENIWTVCEPCHTLIHSIRRLSGAYS
jgi:5-methylcytosine-specific restriction endonuclease McrA